METEALTAFLQGNLVAWSGLPTLSLDELQAALGTPQAHTVEELGYYPADRYVYRMDVPTQGLIAYVRRNNVVLIEAIQPPDLSAAAGLPEPCGILPQEILVTDAYAHEYVYCEKGLVLTIARYLQATTPDKLIRCRGIAPLTTVKQFGPDFYKPFEDRISFGS